MDQKVKVSPSTYYGFTWDAAHDSARRRLCIAAGLDESKALLDWIELLPEQRGHLGTQIKALLISRQRAGAAA